MRTLTNLLAIGLLSFTALHAQESNMSSTVKASEMYADGFSKFRFGGYGEMAASYMDYDWNWVTPQGTSHMNRATVSIPRFILALDYKYSPKWVLSSEIEFEAVRMVPVKPQTPCTDLAPTGSSIFSVRSMNSTE